MKGFTRDHKFVPMTDYKKVTRKSRDQSTKSIGVKVERKKRNNSFKIGDVVKYWDDEKGKITYIRYDSKTQKPLQYKINGKFVQPDSIRKARTVTIPKLHRVPQQEEGRVKFWAEDGDIIASLVDGSFPEEMEVRITTDEDSFSVVGHRSIMDKWSFDEFKNFADKHLERHELMRKKRDPHIKGKKLPKEVVQGAMDDLGGTDVEVERYNPKWKLYEVYVDSDRYYFFPDEESAIKFGRQSIKDTATEYIPDKESENYDEWKNLSKRDLVEKIMEEQSEFGQLSELGAVAKSVAGADGQYHELPNGWIAFQID